MVIKSVNETEKRLFFMMMACMVSCTDVLIRFYNEIYVIILLIGYVYFLI